MKTIITAAALTLVSNMALADAFDYEIQFGSQDLDPSAEASTTVTVNNLGHDTIVSLDSWYEGNHDVVNVDNHYNGDTLVSSPPMLTSLEWVSLGNPDLEV